MDPINDPIARAVPRISGFASQYQRVALVFQGGGALGAHQAGVHHALSEASCEPNWDWGVSISAINAAIVGGNSRENRLARLRQFWKPVSVARSGPAPKTATGFERHAIIPAP